MRHLICIAAAAALACSNLPDPKMVLTCKAEIMQATESLPELLENLDNRQDMSTLEQLLAAGMTALEAQIILDRLDACAKESESH